MCLICLRKQTQKLFHARSTRKYFQFTDNKKAQLKSNQIELNRTELNWTEKSLRTFFSLNLNIFEHSIISFPALEIFLLCVCSQFVWGRTPTDRAGAGLDPPQRPHEHFGYVNDLIEWMHWPLHDFSPKIYCLLFSVFSLHTGPRAVAHLKCCSSSCFFFFLFCD